MFKGLKKQFWKKANAAAEMAAYAAPAEQSSLLSLPDQLQKFLLASGYDFSSPIECAKVNWDDAAIKLSRDSNWRKILLSQINFLWEPVRLVYMQTYIWYIFILEAIDSYSGGHGGLKIRLMGLKTLNCAKGKEVDLSELVTVLAEVLLIPHYALRSYIHWEELDEFTLKATISHNSRSACGTFHFNRQGECVRFETDDRYFIDNDHTAKKLRWVARAEKYKTENGLRFPSQFSTEWVTESGVFEYFRGQVNSISLDEPTFGNT